MENFMEPEFEYRDQLRPSSSPDVTEFLKQEIQSTIAQLKANKDNPKIREICFKKLIGFRKGDPKTFDKILKDEGGELKKEFEIIRKTEEAGKSLPGEVKSQKNKLDASVEKLGSRSKGNLDLTESYRMEIEEPTSQVEEQEKESDRMEQEKEADLMEIEKRAIEQEVKEKVDLLKNLPPELLVKIIDFLDWTWNPDLLNILLSDKYFKFVESHPKFAIYKALESLKMGKSDEVGPILTNMKGKADAGVAPWKSDELQVVADLHLPMEKLLLSREVQNLPPIYEKILIDLMLGTIWNPLEVSQADNGKIKKIATDLKLLGIRTASQSLAERFDSKRGPQFESPSNARLNLDKINEIDWKPFIEAPPRSRVASHLNECMIQNLPQLAVKHAQTPFNEDFLKFLTKHSSGDELYDLFNSLMPLKKDDKQFILRAIKVNPSVYFVASEELQKDPDVLALAVRHFETLTPQSTSENMLESMQFQLTRARAQTDDFSLKEKISKMMRDVTNRIVSPPIRHGRRPAPPIIYETWDFKKNLNDLEGKRWIQEQFMTETNKLGIKLNPIISAAKPIRENVPIAKLDNQSPYQNLVFKFLRAFTSQLQPSNRNERVFNVTTFRVYEPGLKLKEYMRITVDPDQNKVTLTNLNAHDSKQEPFDLSSEGKDERTQEIVLTGEAAKPFLDHWKKSIEPRRGRK